MLRSSNLDSVINELNTNPPTNYIPTRPDSLYLGTGSNSNINVTDITRKTPTNDSNNSAGASVNKTQQVNVSNSLERGDDAVLYADGDAVSISSLQLSAGLLQISEPPLTRVRIHLKELISKQNKIYIDLSEEKYKLDCGEVSKLNDMMNDVKLYKEKLYKIKKQMQSIYQRTKDLKKRAANIENTKQRQYQRKLEKQRHEESLIGSGQKT